MIWRWAAVRHWVVDPKLGAEIGVKKGQFTAYMLKHFPQLTMVAVDPWEPQPGANEDYLGWDFDAIYETYLENTKLYRARIREFKGYSHEAADCVSDHSLDFVFIDAQHDYLSVKLDIKLWLPKVKPGGLISGHDYAEKFPGVVQAVNEAFDDPMLGDNDTWGVYV
jgi:hypothetical protein